MGCFTSPIQDDQKPLWVMNEPDKPKFSLSDLVNLVIYIFAGTRIIKNKFLYFLSFVHHLFDIVSKLPKI